MKRVAGVFCLIFLAIGCGYCATVIADYSWEDGATILGSYNSIEAANVGSSDPVRSGGHSLKLVDGSSIETPQAYVAYITGLSNGDMVSANLWVYDITPGPGVSPRARIWAHYVKNNNINDYAGSASGNLAYSDGTGWSNLGWNWTIDLGYDRTGLVIEVRTYTDSGDTVWVDDLSVAAPDTAEIYVPGHQVPEPCMLLIALGALIKRWQGHHARGVFRI